MDTMHPRPRFNFLKWALVLSIVIVLNLLFTYSIHLAYPRPDFQKFCPMEQVVEQPRTKEACLLKGGSWTENVYYSDRAYSTPSKPVPAPNSNEPAGYCDIYFTCNKDFNAANDLYNRNVFIARVILGVVSLAAGFAAARHSAVSLGLSFGGVLSLFIATTGYWSNLGEYWRVLVLAAALAFLIWLGVKKISN